MTGTAATRAQRALKVFFSYARRDEAMRNKLANHLAVLENQGLIERWYDRQIQPGDTWADEIDRHLDEADIILLLITDNFMSSRYCYGLEMKRAIERSDAGQAIVIPVLLRDVEWSIAPFARLQALPENGRPVANFGKIDKAYANITRGIRQRVDDYWASRAGSKPGCPALSKATEPSEALLKEVLSKTPFAETLQKAIDQKSIDGRTLAKGAPQQPEYIQNPYDFEHPAKLYFRGRQNELTELTSHLAAGRSALVLGLQRMGKTSLVERALDRLQGSSQQRRVVVLKIDMFASWTSFNSYMDFFFTLVNLLAEHVGSSVALGASEATKIRDAFSEVARSAYDIERYERFKLLLRDAIRKLDASLILFIDEFQEVERVFQRARERRSTAPFDAGVMRWIGSLAKEQVLQLMICGRYRVIGIEEREALEIFKTHHRISLGPLDEHSARELVRDPVAQQIAYQDEAVRAILDLTGRLPYLIQLLCSQLVNMSRVRRSAVIRKRDVDEIAEGILSDPASKVNLGVLYSDFKEMPNGYPWKALCALAKSADEPGQYVSLSELAQRLKRDSSPAISSDLLPVVMEELVTAGIVDETGIGRLRTYRVTPDLLRRWLRKRHIG